MEREYQLVGRLTHGEGDYVGEWSNTTTLVFACDCGVLVWDIEKHNRGHVTVGLGLGF